MPKQSDSTLSSIVTGEQKPVYGFVESARKLSTRYDEPRFTITLATVGDLSASWPNLKSRQARHPVIGLGVGVDSTQSMLPAAAECLERYCTAIFSPEQFIIASGKELGSAALDLDVIPRCSNHELAHPRCPLVRPDKSTAIRWIRGLSLMSGKPVFLPAVMVYLHAGFINNAERIWFPITTGCASYRTLEGALVRALCEVIERDAISITWLQRLTLPKIEVDACPSALQESWQILEKSSKRFRYFFFDATTDIGITTIYGLQVCPSNARACTLVSCCTAFSPAEALEKVIRDMAAVRLAFREPRTPPASWDDFNDIMHGAVFMAHRSQSSAFDFLTSSRQRCLFSKIQNINFQSDHERLRYLLGILTAKGLEAYAVDLTSDEGMRVGMRVVRVIIPGLQPVGFQYRARYLGHSRLYEAARCMGYPVHDEADLNPWPQPFF